MKFLNNATAMLVFSMLLTACATPNAAPDKPMRTNISTLPAEASARAQAPDAVTRAILRDINAYRAQYKLPPLANDSILQRAAAVHSADMAARNFFGHYNPDGQGPGERLKAVDHDFNSGYAENIGMFDGVTEVSPDILAEAFVKQWITSPLHRKNIRNGSYVRSGIGIARAGKKVYATQVFATK
ncbi:MAG: CAP domain-containing protein [Parvibaculum sp.]